MTEQDAVARWVDEGGAGDDPERRTPRASPSSRKMRVAMWLGGAAAVLAAGLWLHRVARAHHGHATGHARGH